MLTLYFGLKMENNKIIINFGKNGELSRKLVEKYLKKNGNQSLSKLMRRLVVYYLSNKKELEKNDRIKNN